jgi:hypothetical protein
MIKTTFLLFRFLLLLCIGVCREQLKQVNHLNSLYTDPNVLQCQGHIFYTIM